MLRLIIEQSHETLKTPHIPIGLLYPCTKLVVDLLFLGTFWDDSLDALFNQPTRDPWLVFRT